jgi:hypothetical protein
MLLIHPPVAKPCEPPAGIARLAGVMDDYPVTVIDANLDIILRSMHVEMNAYDTWTRRAKKNLDAHLDYLKKNKQWGAGRYIRAVMDINRLLERSDQSPGIRVNLGDYQDKSLSPVKSSDLLRAAETPEKSPFYKYFRDAFTPHDDGLIGISINFLSQALHAFAITGYLKREYPGIKI